MKRQPWNPETVHTCRLTQDGTYLVITRTGQVGSSPVEIPEGSRVRISGGVARRSQPTPEAAVKSLEAIDRIRGQG